MSQHATHRTHATDVLAPSRNLDQAIAAAEADLGQRRRLLGERARDLGGTVKARLQSPLALLLIAGAGFALGRLSSPVHERVVDRDGGEEVVVGPSKMALIMDVVSLASSVLAFLPMLRRAQVPDVDERTAVQ